MERRMENDELSSTRPSLAFPLGLALVLLVLLSICAFFLCCIYWDSIRSLFVASLDQEQDPEADSDHKPPRPKTIGEGEVSKIIMGTKSKSTKKMMIMIMLLLVTMMMFVADAGSDTNGVFDPCSDATIQRWDGFTFGLAFSTKDSFFSNQTQLSPCDKRLSLSAAQLALFRPKVDEISLLSINSTFNPAKAGGYMVAFAGRKYAARSPPILVADDSNTITSFTLVLEFDRGILQNLYWKKFGCKACSGDYSVCLNGEDCAVPNSKCKINGGSFDCNLSIQLTFSGTDKHLQVLNSWYEVKKLRKYSLYSLFKDLLI